MLPLPSMDFATNAHRAAAQAAEVRGGPKGQPPTRNRTRRPPGGVGRQTAMAAVVADDMQAMAELFREFAKRYDKDGLDEPAGLLRNEAANLTSYADLVLNGPIGHASQSNLLVTAPLFGPPPVEEPAVDRSVAGMGLADTGPLKLPSLFDD